MRQSCRGNLSGGDNQGDSAEANRQPMAFGLNLIGQMESWLWCLKRARTSRQLSGDWGWSYQAQKADWKSLNEKRADSELWRKRQGAIYRRFYY
jgi:hypothetical protein